VPTITPVIPPTPGPSSTWQEWDIYLRAVSEVNRVAHAEAQMATAVAMQNSVAAQNALAAAIAQSAVEPLPTRAELAFAILRDHPQATILTNGQIVSGCAAIVDAYVSRYPNAVSD
jgi:hypothetical protein